jgi:Barrel-sandwich domain of CusB or HlyD membrane-fusion
MTDNDPSPKRPVPNSEPQPGTSVRNVPDSRRQALAISLELAKNAMKARTLDDLQFLLVNDTRSLLQFDRSILVVHLDGKSALAATNNQPQLDKKAEFVRRVDKLAPSLKEVDRGLVLFAGRMKTDGLSEKAATELDAYMSYAGSSCLMIVPLSVYGRVIGHLLLEFFGDAAPGEIETLTLMNMVPFFSSALAEKWMLAKKKRFSKLFFSSVSTGVRGRRLTSRYLKFGIVLAIAVAIMIALSLPVTLKIGGECEVVPEYEHYAFVEMDGIVEKVLTKEGDSVKKGQVVAVLDSSEIDYKIREAERLLESYRTEIGILRNMAAEDPTKLAESQLVAIKRRIGQQNLNFLKWQRRFLEIRSPADGIVLTEKVETLVGKRFQAGGHFCTVAPHDDLQMAIFVKESDVAAVKVGQKCEAYFNYEPSKAHELIVRRISPRSEVRDTAGGVFKVTADFAKQPPNIKPGMQGIARVNTHQASLWYVLSRRMKTRINEILLVF